MSLAAREPTHIHRLFASLLGLWLAFLLNRTPGQELSWVWVAAVVGAAAVHVFQLQRGFDHIQPAPRTRTHFVNILTVLLTAAALSQVDQRLYRPDQTLSQVKVFLIAVVICGWIVTHWVYHRFRPEWIFFEK